MKVRHISILGGLLLSTVIFTGHLLFSTHVLENGFSELEHRYVINALESARHQLQHNLIQLDNTVIDWASWDDTYVYVQDKNAEFEKSNIPTETFESQDLSAIIIRDANGNTVFARAVIPDKRDSEDILAALLQISSRPLPAIPDSLGGTGGIALIDGDYYLLAQRPILSSEGFGPSMGRLTMVRSISDAMMQGLNRGTGHDVSLERSEDAVPSPAKSKDASTYVVNIDKHTAVGVCRLSTLTGTDARLLVRINREMTAYGRKVTDYNSIGIALAMILLFLGFYIFLHFKIFNRLEGLDAQVSAIRADPGSQGFVEAKGNDEIATLSANFKALLGEIENAHQNQLAQAERIVENEKFLNQVMNSINVGILLIDPETRIILSINDHALKLAGRTRDEVVGHICHQLTCPAEKDQCPILDQHQPQDISQRKLLTSSGDTIPIMKSASVVIREGKRILLETIVDMTEIEQSRRELEKVKEGLEVTVAERTRELAKANKDLIALDKAKTLFLSSASHELRTPLTAILGFVILMQKQFKDFFVPRLEQDTSIQPRVQRFAENLSVVRSEAERLGRLVNDLLDLNKIESGSMEWRDEPLELETLLHAAAEVFTGQAAEIEGLDFKVDPIPEAMAIKADPDRIQQVLINLLNNAFKFTPQGEIRLTVDRDGDFVRFRVIDTGPGIPEEDLEHVFDLFYQVSEGVYQAGRPFGTGLGLAICRQIVTHYGGVISVESRLGVGSTFFFTIPLMKREDA
ncbi:ATP-binding protein [Pseudodesulfovibrio sp.]|uniref:sensor histidine kinase n=1 Tax=unclassified Pseudodesulfovibrio TaxID=2661612 RepID=UPI003B0037B3